MKKLIIILSATAFIAVSCGRMAKKLTTEQTQTIEMLKEFYTLYFTEMDGREWDLQVAADIFNQYTTVELQKRISRNQLICDPFVDKEGYDKAWIETLEIRPTERYDSEYSIRYGNDDDQRFLILYVEKDKDRYLIHSMPHFWICCKDYEEIDEDENDNDIEDENEYFAPEYLPENRIQLNAERLALTARNGMSVEYDSVRNAIAFASEVMNLSSFPILPDGYSFGLNFDNYDRDNAKYVKWGTGMKPFRWLLTYAEDYRNNGSIAGLDKLIRRYGTLIKLLVPYEKYVANGWERTTNQLLTAYEDLAASAGSFGKVYEIMCEDHNWNYPDYYYKQLVPFVRDKQMKAFISDRKLEKGSYLAVKRGEVNCWSLVWAYSFWGRRYNENPGNIPHLAAALKILRDELYAPKAKPPKVDKNIPPIEPYLASDIKPNEKIYPWKMYTDRVKFLEHGGYDYDYIVVEQNGDQRWLLSNLDDDIVLNRGDVIDVTWDMEIMYYYEEDGERVKFCEWAHSVKMIEAGATTRFAKKYGSSPKIEYKDEEAIDEDAKSKIINKLLDYLQESKKSEITEALKMFSKNPERFKITILDCEEWDDSIYGYGIYLSLSRGEFYNSIDDEDVEIFDIIMSFIYNPDTDTLHIDVEVAHG